MKILYLDLGMGAAGDMLTGALISLFDEDEQRRILDKLNAVAPDGVTVKLEDSVRAGIQGKHIHVFINGTEEGHEQEHEEHHHASMAEICEMIDNMDLPEKVVSDAKMVYARIAEAESEAHHTSVSEVHFHEVGMKDAVMDVASVCYLFYLIKPDRVYASPVRVGKGTVRCMHGIMPVPAPATTFLLMNVPVYAGNIDGEMCTPTGAALITYFTDDFMNMPFMKIEKTGYGMGTKDFEQVNAVRVFYGEEVCIDVVTETGTAAAGDRMYELDFNVDDMTAEETGFAMDRLFAAGAAEVFTVPVGMKKSRPGTLITIICSESKKEDIVKTAFRYTSTIGMREKHIGRYTMKRQVRSIDTEFGPIRIKKSLGYGIKREKYEYDDLARVAVKSGMSLEQVRKRVEEADEGRD